jgi:hypothetical protein
MANYFDLSGHSTRVGWYPNGKGGPIKQPAAAGAANRGLLEYSSGALEASVSGDDLKVFATPVGTLVTAIVKKDGIVPGATISFMLLVPDVNDAPNGVAIHTIGVLSTHRPTPRLGPGQLETYTELPLTGTALNVEFPL